MKPNRLRPRVPTGEMALFEEFNLLVNYDYQPFEQATREYPGCDEAVTVTSVVMGEKLEIMHLLTDVQIEDFESRILENLNG